MQHVPVIVLDFGSQYTQLIARRIRELNVYCEIWPFHTPFEKLRAADPRGVILSGGPASVYEPGAPHCDPKLLDLDIPVLGICYGMQLACHYLGGKVGQTAHTREYGRATLTVNDANALFRAYPTESTVWMSHGDQVQSVSGDFVPLASTDTCPLAAVKHKSRPVFGIQFHPEVAHTPHGGQILANFLRDVCGCTGQWKMQAFIDRTVEEIRAKVGKKRVICGLSGGVDSSVCAALLLKAIGQQVACIYVDNGLMRAGETEVVRHTFKDWFKADLHAVDARERFLLALKGVVEPQEKRKIIGKVFIDVFKQEAKSIPDAKFLAQGTLYPDVIESGGAADGPAATIKLHHNVGGLPAELGFDLIEPLRDLFKDEVRKLGQVLGLPDQIIWRHPFPGPGLAIRVLGEVTRDKLDLLRDCDEILLEEIVANNLYRSTSQVFAVLLPVQSVGVMGDGRTYESVVAIRAVETQDFMTADWARIPYAVLATISSRIINEVRGVNRVVYDISSKPPATIEWE
jgi:GMP synthase (glutamine-hydrolysing)